MSGRSQLVGPIKKAIQIVAVNTLFSRGSNKKREREKYNNNNKEYRYDGKKNNLL